MNKQIVLNGLKYHPKCLEAYLEGERVQWFSKTEGEWIDHKDDHMFMKGIEYRIKQQFKPCLGSKKVNYFGIILVVNAECKWIATDKSGGMYAYDTKPQLGGSFWKVPGSDYSQLGLFEPNELWKESLQGV